MRNLLQRTLFDKFQVVLKHGLCSKVPILTIIDEKQTRNSAGPEQTLDLTTELSELQESDGKSVLDPPISKDSYTVAPSLKPTFNLAAYINNSETLQQLVKLGVDLSRIERRKGLAKFILQLDFKNDMQNHIRFLHDVCGLPKESFGTVLTKNPLIFKENLFDLETRVNYLKSKLFEPTDISRIAEVNPFWLMFPTQRIDRRLGYFQKKFHLTGVEVRQLTVKQPKLITYRLDSVEQNAFSIQEEFGFSLDETKLLILQTPKVLMLNRDTLIARLDYVHNIMKLSHEQIVKSSEILQYREHRVKQRHEYLQLIGRAQYDPTKDLYVSMRQLVVGTDAEFAMDVANTSYDKFASFLRQL